MRKQGASNAVALSPSALSTAPKKTTVTVEGLQEISFYCEKFVPGTPTEIFRVNGESAAILDHSEMSRRKVSVAPQAAPDVIIDGS
jgi:hypothetical protein